ncbi:hypothetical protein Goshw_023888 [Gossypium schwendimanii]|uniref:Uncharacterized protein n=1 Tax=Gossypium schwendimanii TaxID=34291 RepID=A0A7J9N5E2_GOSSC|nr:hypothetical protein [Gossypium schwendimanii]
MFQVSDVTEKETLITFQNGLKLWVKQELGLGKDKLGSSKSKEKGICERITRKMLLMEMTTATIVVMGIHELGRRNLTGKETS